VNSRALLVVIVPEHRRDELVDLLMAAPGVDGFTRSSAAGFSRQHSHFNLRESVQGYTDQERFEIACDADQLDSLLGALGVRAGRDRFFYWVAPLLREGSVGADPNAARAP
jgi:hypothetical protein